MHRSSFLTTTVLATIFSLLSARAASAGLLSGGSDHCATATPITGYGPFLGDNIGATTDGFPFPCNPHFGADVWYDWTAPESGAIYLTLCNPGTTFDTKLAVWDGPSCLGNLLACNDDTEPGVLDCSTVGFDAVAGNVYKIYISGSIGAASTYEMTMARQVSTFCEPGSAGVRSCPCGNPPSGPGRGCNNYGAHSGGASLVATGAPVLFPDQFSLTVTGENPTATTVFFTGSATTSSAGAIQGAGVRCVTGLKRLFTASASGGTIVKPGGTDPSISARSAAVGAPISAGQVRYYFTVYRDPQASTPCGSATSTINVSNAVSARWAP